MKAFLFSIFFTLSGFGTFKFFSIINFLYLNGHHSQLHCVTITYMGADHSIKNIFNAEFNSSVRFSPAVQTSSNELLFTKIHTYLKMVL